MGAVAPRLLCSQKTKKKQKENKRPALKLVCVHDELNYKFPFSSLTSRIHMWLNKNCKLGKFKQIG